MKKKTTVEPSGRAV